MSEFPEIEGVGAVEAPRGRVVARRRSRYLVPALAVIGAAAAAFVLLADRCGTAAEAREVEALTADAHRFVELVRSDLPASWSIEKVLEFPTIRPGSQAMMELQHQRGQARVNLESKVDALVPEGERPDLRGMTDWIAKPSWMPRARVVALAAELRRLDAAVAGLREDAGLDPKPLPLEGETLRPLPERLALPTLPDGVDHDGVRIWPLPIAVVVYHWGHNPRTCREQRPHCRYHDVTWVSWDGEIIASTSVEPPPPEHVAWQYDVAGDGTFFTASHDGQKTMRLSRYEPGADAPMIGDVEMADANARIDEGEKGLSITADQATDNPKFYQVSRGVEAEPVTWYPRNIGFVRRALDRRTGSSGGIYLGGDGSLTVERNEGVVYSVNMPSGEGATSEVTRIADFTPLDEEYLREMVAGPTGVVLLFEGSMSRLKLLLSQDGGRTWTGAAPP
jgi:hypothetical protein